MLVQIDRDNNNKIVSFNLIISKNDANQYLSENCLWIENILPTPEIIKGKHAEYYLGENNEILVNYVDDEVTVLTDEQQAILEIAINVDYLVCLADLGL